MEFEFDEKNGIVKDKLTGERCVIFSKTRMQEMFSKLFETFASGALVIIREMSKTTGQLLVNHTPENVKGNMEQLMETYVQRFMDAGVGRIEIAHFEPEEGKLRFRVYDNFFAEIRHQEATMCCYLEGLAEGMYEKFWAKSPKIVKLACIERGDPYCEWEIGPRK